MCWSVADLLPGCLSEIGKPLVDVDAGCALGSPSGTPAPGMGNVLGFCVDDLRVYDRVYEAARQFRLRWLPQECATGSFVFVPG